MAEPNPRINQQPIRDRFNQALKALQLFHSNLDARYLFIINLSQAERGNLLELQENLQARLQCVSCALRLIDTMDDPARDRNQDPSTILFNTSERVSEVMDNYERSKAVGMPYSIKRLTGDLCEAVNSSGVEPLSK